MVLDLQEARIGDPGRLAHIMERIENGRVIYNSDEQYVRQKFKQLREEITRESEDEPEQPDPSQDGVTSPPPDPEPPVSRKAGNDTRPSKAWYILPIFLGILGGLIAYARLRKRSRGMAYKTLGLGTGLTALFFALILAAGISDTNPASEYTDEEIKRLAVTIPYESLVDQSDTHAGEIVRYEGALVQVKKQPFDEYILRVGINPERFTATDIILLKYTPVSDEEKAWLDKTENELKPFMEDGLETVTFWGISKGLAEYNTVFGQKVTLPEVDVILLERHAPSKSDTSPVDPEPPEILTTSKTASNAASGRHAISYDSIPVYADESTVVRALIDAVRIWDMANAGVDFAITESDADVNVRWARYLPGSALGLHQAAVTDDGTRERHSITVRLGTDDCHSNYQQFTHEALQYTIAHEIGHYLGLRHVDDKSHLMYSGELFNVDSAQVYDDMGLDIPHMERPEIATVAGQEIQSEIDLLNEDLEQVSLQRQELKNAPDGEALDDNTNLYNDLTQQIQELEDQLTCVNIA